MMFVNLKVYLSSLRVRVAFIRNILCRFRARQGFVGKLPFIVLPLI